MALWEAPLAAQVGRAYAALETPLAERPAAATLIFARGTVLGHDDAALLLSVERTGRAPMVVRLTAPSDHAELSYRDNLRLLASAPGLRLRVAGHIVPDRPGTLAGVAVLADGHHEIADAPRLSLPEDWVGRVCLGLDQLQAAHVVGAKAEHAAMRRAEAACDPLEPLRRRIRRMALGGRGTIGPSAMPGIERECTELAKRHMTTAGAILNGLARAALRKDADIALAWLQAAAFDEAATRAIRRAAWGA
jgi:hypothetical protein